MRGSQIESGASFIPKQGACYALTCLDMLAWFSSFSNFPYFNECAKYHLRRPPVKHEDAAQGIAEREPYEKKGMELHEKGQWKDSNCLLIHAVNISSDHAVNVLNTIGFNYAALGDDKQALNYFEDATGFTFDLDNWLKHKARPPFNKVLNKPIYKEYEQRLYRYYKEMGLEVPFSGLTVNQSFKTTCDCVKVTSEIEKTICQVKELADADIEMRAVYKSLLSGVPEGEKNQLKHDQLDWIKNRNKSCSNSANIVNCIKDSYSNRIGALKKQESALPASGAGYPVQWYEGFELHIYYKNGKQPKTLDDVKRLFQGKWEYPIKAYGDGDAAYNVGSCRDFFKAKENKFYPGSNLDRGPYSFVGIYCIAAKLILDGKPAKKSFIENLKMDGTIAKYLPADVEYIISNEQPRHTSGSWADVEKVKVVKVTNEEIEFSSSDANHFVRKIAVGDFNGDGVQDILLMVGHHVKEGSHFENSLYLMTRFGPNDLLKTVKKYTALEDD